MPWNATVYLHCRQHYLAQNVGLPAAVTMLRSKISFLRTAGACCCKRMCFLLLWSGTVHARAKSAWYKVFGEKLCVLFGDKQKRKVCKHQCQATRVFCSEFTSKLPDCNALTRTRWAQACAGQECKAAGLSKVAQKVQCLYTAHA